MLKIRLTGVTTATNGVEVLQNGQFNVHLVLMRKNHRTIAGRGSPSLLCNTYMRVEREVQVLSELGYRWATPVLKHMQVGLALKLPTHTHRGDRLVHELTSAAHLLLNSAGYASVLQLPSRLQAFVLVSVDTFTSWTVCNSSPLWRRNSWWNVNVAWSFKCSHCPE